MLRLVNIVMLVLGILCSSALTLSDNLTTTAASTTTTTSTSTTPTPNTTTPSAPFPLVPIYQVKNGSNICLLVQMNMKFAIKYYTTKNEQATAYFYLNGSSGIRPNVDGSCGDTSETLRLDWWPSWRLQMQFAKVPAGDHFSLNLVTFNFTMTDKLFPDVNETNAQFMVRNDSQFTCAIGSYFQCMAKQTSKLTKLVAASAPVEVYLTVSDLKAEAFRSNSDPLFLGNLSECSADYVPNKVVPIVVGVALACMIVIALVAFIVASRRRQSGYQSI